MLKMYQLLEHIKSAIPGDWFTDLELANLIPGSENRRYGLVKRALAKGDLIRLRRGAYCLSERHRRAPLNLFSLSQMIYGPSCISLESALSYHAWIPEAVYTITCVSSERSRDFSNPLGIFSYQHIPTRVLLCDVERISSEGNTFLMAGPWRALVDYVYVYKKPWKSLAPLSSSLRIEAEDLLRQFDPGKLEEIDRLYQSRRVSRFIAGILREVAKQKRIPA